MGQTVTGMSNAMKSMNIEQIQSTMDKFEKSFVDMDVSSNVMEKAMQNTDTSTPADEVEKMMQMMADEEQLEINDKLSTDVPKVEDESQVKAKELEARLAKIRES